MALELPYKRDHVYAWMVEFFGQSEVTSLRDFLADKLGDDADMVIRRHHANTSLIDLLMADTASYVMDFRNANAS